MPKSKRRQSSGRSRSRSRSPSRKRRDTLHDPRDSPPRRRRTLTNSHSKSRSPTRRRYDNSHDTRESPSFSKHRNRNYSPDRRKHSKHSSSPEVEFLHSTFVNNKRPAGERQDSLSNRRQSHSNEKERKKSSDHPSTSKDSKSSDAPPVVSFGLLQRFQMLNDPEIQPLVDNSLQNLKISTEKTFEERADIQSHSCNPNAPYLYAFPRRIHESCILSLFRKRPLKPEGETAESLRDQQQAQLVEFQLRKAGDYIKKGQNFEAIQCCNHALNLMPQSTDAFLGRAIAANNMENFVSAISDLDKILEISPQHKRALFIIDKVLIQQAEKFEEQKDWQAAKQAYKRASTEFNSKDAADALAKLEKQLSKKNGRNVIDLTIDDEPKPKPKERKSLPSNSDIDEVERRQRLLELERFKQTLVKRAKR